MSKRRRMKSMKTPVCFQSVYPPEEKKMTFAATDREGGEVGEWKEAQHRQGSGFKRKKRGKKNPSRENFLKRMNSIYHTDGAQWVS